MNRSCSDDQIKEALHLYQHSNLSSLEIADKFDISTGTLTAWAKESGLKLRGRGRRKYDEPTARQREVLRFVDNLGCKRTGERLGVSKQAVYNIVKRWRNWIPPKGPQPGDVIVFRERKMAVISTDGVGGYAWDYKAQRKFKITAWVVRGRHPKKIDTDTTYATKPTNGSATNGHRPKAKKK